MNMTAKLVLAFFGGVATGVLALLGWMALCYGGSRQERSRVDLMLSEMDGKDEGNGEINDTETVTLLWLLDVDWLHQSSMPFSSRTQMERWMARQLEENGILSCEFTYLQGINPNFWDVMADGKRVGVADLRNDKTMNK